MGLTAEDFDATVWGDDSRQYMLGYVNVMLSDVNVLWDNTEAAAGPVDPGSFVTMGSGEAEHIVSVFMGIRAAPSIGVPVFMAGLKQMEFTQGAALGDLLASSVQMRGSSLYDENIHCWGAALAVGADLSVTTSNGSVDNGASTTGGWAAQLHLAQTTVAVGSGDYELRVEHSANDSTWSTLATFTLDGSASGAERLDGTGTVNRYVRFACTKTAGTVRPWVSFARW
jgi:hypothetical protein